MISAAVEGIVDEMVVRRLIIEVGGHPGTVYGKSGKAYLRRQIQGYNNAAKRYPWIILVDLDQDAECAPPFCREWLPDPAPYLCFRIAVREVESWLMADSVTISSFLSVARSKVPNDPELLRDPKTTMVNLARRSRRRGIRDDRVPRDQGGRPVGPAYASRLIEYVQSSWRPEIARKRADSLNRAIECLLRIMENFRL